MADQVFPRLMTSHSKGGSVNLFLPPTNEVAEENVFTPVCQSFCSQWGVYPSMQWGVHSSTRQSPMGRHHPPSWQTPSWADTSQADTPPGQTPPWEDTHPQADTPHPGQTHPLGRHSHTPSHPETTTEVHVRILLVCILV